MMRQIFHRVAHVHPLTLFVAGAVLMGLSVLLVLLHVRTIVAVRDVSVPIVGQLPNLERRLQALQEQTELGAMQSALRVGSQEEQVHMYALPAQTDVSRLIATFEIMRDVLEREGLLSGMSDISITDPEKRADGAFVRTVSVEFSAQDEGLRTVLLLSQLSGLLTVGDVLTKDEITLLTDRVEQENPAGIVSLEQFLSANLLAYAKDSKAYEQQLERSFTSTAFLSAFKNILQTSLLHDARILLVSDLGEALVAYKLWPMQIMTVQRVAVAPGDAPKWQKVHMELAVFSRE